MRRCHLRWNRPEEAVLEGGGGGGEEEQQQQNAHPCGWTAKHSAEYSKTDFVNDHTQETTWDTPSHPAPTTKTRRAVARRSGIIRTTRLRAIQCEEGEGYVDKVDL